MSEHTHEARNDTWTFTCNRCRASRECDSEVEALNAAGSHDDNMGHFDFTITDPEGVEQYP